MSGTHRRSAQVTVRCVGQTASMSAARRSISHTNAARASGCQPTSASVKTRIHGTVINNGNADARAITVQFVDISDEEAAVPIGQPQTIAEIPVGGSGVAQVAYDTDDKAGERKIRMDIDPTNFISERNEADNVATRVLTIAEAPAPNLFISADNVGFDPASPQPGAQVTIFATVLNNGTADAANVVIQFQEGIASRPIALNQVIDSIPAGSSAVARITFDSLQIITLADRLRQRIAQRRQP